MASAKKEMFPARNVASSLTLDKGRDDPEDEATPSPFDIAAEKLANHSGWNGFFEAYHEMKRKQAQKFEEGN